MPTLRPLRENATARFAATVDFPTPPFPLPTATTLVSVPGPKRLVRVPRTRSMSDLRSSADIVPMLI